MQLRQALVALPRGASAGRIQAAPSFDPFIEGHFGISSETGAVRFSRVFVLGLKAGSGVCEMMSAAPLGALAEVILEQYGELIDAAIEGAVRHRLPIAPLHHVMPPEIRGVRFTSEEMAQMHIQPGNWVAVATIGDIQPRAILEINLSTWKWREMLEPAELSDALIRPAEAVAFPPAARQAAS